MVLKEKTGFHVEVAVVGVRHSATSMYSAHLATHLTPPEVDAWSELGAH